MIQIAQLFFALHDQATRLLGPSSPRLGAFALGRQPGYIDVADRHALLAAYAIGEGMSPGLGSIFQPAAIPAAELPLFCRFVPPVRRETFPLACPDAIARRTLSEDPVLVHPSEASSGPAAHDILRWVNRLKCVVENRIDRRLFVVTAGESSCVHSAHVYTQLQRVQTHNG